MLEGFVRLISSCLGKPFFCCLINRSGVFLSGASLWSFEISDDVIAFVLADKCQGVFLSRPEEFNELRNLVVATLENATYVIGAFPYHVLEIKALVISADLYEAFFRVRVDTFSHCDPLYIFWHA